VYFDSIGEVFAMAGHGPYVWFCYGITALVLCVILFEARRRRLGAEQRVRGVVRRKQASANKVKGKE
jgi:heme exporter protein D